MKKIQDLYKAAMRLVFGYEFMCWHDDADGARKIFHCKTYEEAFSWVCCALNCSTVTITQRGGYVVCKRFAVA